jgi:hypothetical protein
MTLLSTNNQIEKIQWLKAWPNHRKRRGKGLLFVFNDGNLETKIIAQRKLATSLASDSSRHELASLEVNVSGKQLNDDGLSVMVDGLRDALLSAQPGHEVRLLELNLSNTVLTVRSLRRLAEVIALSAQHITDIDLSENKIFIDTEQDEDDWEEFLQSFRRCRRMRRLVLSGNNFQSPASFEVFARVYSQHLSVDNSSIIPEFDSIFNVIDSSPLSPTHIPRAPSFSSIDPAESSTRDHLPKMASGLRSIPYIILQDVQLSSFGALWLSYVLENHYKPHQLLTPLKPGPVAAMLAEYWEKTQCEGLVYKPNDNVTTNGWKLLSAADYLRRQLEDSPTVDTSDSEPLRYAAHFSN